MNAGSACFDECLHNLEGVERSAEPGLCIRHDWCKPFALGAALGVLDLVGTGQCLVDPATELGACICRIQALVGIDVTRGIGVGGNLPAGEINRVESGSNHL